MISAVGVSYHPQKRNNTEINFLDNFSADTILGLQKIGKKLYAKSLILMLVS